jgi:hypothetical protein
VRGRKRTKMCNTKAVKKMYKINTAISAVIFIILMIALPMAVQTVAAEGASGVSFSKESWAGDPDEKFPWFVECEHSHLYYPDNMMVGLGVYTSYDPDGVPKYDTETGGSLPKQGGTLKQ